MKPILSAIVLLILAGCSAPIEELIQDAKECVNKSSNELGVVGASDEQREACWLAVNERMEADNRRQLEKEKEEREKCPSGYVKFVYRGEASCVRQADLQDWIRRMGR